VNKRVDAPVHNYYKNLKAERSINPAKRAVKSLVGIPFILRNSTGKKSILHALKQVGTALNITEKGFLIKLAREIQGITADNSKWHQLLRLSKMYVDQERRHVAELISKEVLTAYDPNTKLTDAEAASITQELLKTDISVLQGKSYDLNDIAKLLRNKSYRNSEMSKISRQLEAFNAVKGQGNGNYYIRQALNLGEIMATGASIEDNPMLNAYNIVQMRNLTQTATGDLKLADELVDQVATIIEIQTTAQEINEPAAGRLARE